VGANIVVDEGADLDYPPDLYRFDRVAHYVEDLDSINEGHLQAFRERGYLAVRHAISPDRVNASLAALSDLAVRADTEHFPGLFLQYESWVGDRAGEIPRDERQDNIRKLMYFTGHDPRLQSVAADSRLGAVLRALIGKDELVMFQDMALLKPPGGGREKPWHQDKAFFAIDVTTPVVGVWIALDEATPDNGCMHVIPGSHLEGPQVHFNRRDFQICDTNVAGDRDVMVPLGPGGLLFFDGLIHHGTPANRTPHRRRALQFHYCAAEAPWGTEEQRLALFGSEGKGATC
jgi:phytanoyl-CoA hydroxylase